MLRYQDERRLRHISRYHEVRHEITVAGLRVVCRVTGEYLADTYIPDARRAELLDIAKIHFDEITDEWGHKIGSGQFEQ